MVTGTPPEAGEGALPRYTRDLTELARRGRLDPVIGRDEEIRRVIQVLSRRTENSPLLIGEPVVGKTAIAEGLAGGMRTPWCTSYRSRRPRRIAMVSPVGSAMNTG
jgi:ATP-dependent Clp protease ATP-binding subunit ClpA